MWLRPHQDPRGTRLRQWLHQDAVLGVVSKHFRLSDHPPLGQWRVDVAAASVSLFRLKRKLLKFILSAWLLSSINISFIVLILKKINKTHFHNVNNFLLFHLLGFQDVFSEKTFTVAYHGTEPVFYFLCLRPKV